MVQFIFATDETGFRHLYLYTVQMALPNGKITSNDGGYFIWFTPCVNSPSHLFFRVFSYAHKFLLGFCRSILIDKQPLTHGEWEVIDQWLWVDTHRGWVYFIGLRDGPLSNHLYVTSYRRPGSNIVRLTKDGFSHSVFMNKAFNFTLNHSWLKYSKEMAI